MNKLFVQNVFFVLIINLLIKGIWIFGIDRHVQITVGYSAYGQFQTLFNLSLIFQIILDLGLTTFNAKRVAKKPENVTSILFSGLYLKGLLSVLYLILFTSIAFLIGISNHNLIMVLGVGLIQIFNSMLLYVRSSISGLQMFKVDGAIAVLDRLFMIIFCGSILFLPILPQNSFSIQWFIYLQVICYGLSLCIALKYLLKVCPKQNKITINQRQLKTVIKKSMPYAFLIFLMSIYMRSDSVFLKLVAPEGKGDLQAGIYASAFRLLDVTNIFGLTVAGILLSLFTKLISEKKPIAVVIKTSVNLMIPISSVVAILTYFYSTNIMALLYKGNFLEQSALVLQFLMIAFPAYCLMYIYSTLLTANHNIKSMIQMSVIGVFLSLILHPILIYRCGVVGAAYTVVIVEWLMAGFAILYTHKYFNLPHNVKWIASHVGCILLNIFIVYFIEVYSDFYWLSKMILSLFICLLVHLFFTGIKIDQIKNLIGSKIDK